MLRSGFVLRDGRRHRSMLLVSLALVPGWWRSARTSAKKFPPAAALEALNFVISFAVITALFAMTFALPDVHIAWRDVWLGAAVTSLLFTIGKFLIGSIWARLHRPRRTARPGRS
jgi:membrane protein